MEGGRLTLYKRISVFYLVGALVVIGLVFLISYVNENITSANPLIHWTIQYSTPISLVLILISVALGYFLATVTSLELNKTKKDTKRLLELLFLFLNNEEQEVIHHLVECKGRSTQADISRLPSMNRVKAFRAVQRMVDKNLVNISAHGKLRHVELRPNVFELLTGVN